MNGTSTHSPALDDKIALRRIMWHVSGEKALGWAVLLFAFAISGHRSGALFSVGLIFLWISAYRVLYAQSAIRMLPVRIRSLGKGVWLTAVLYPMLGMAALLTLHAWFTVVHHGFSWYEAGGGAIVRFTQLLALWGILSAGPCIRGKFGAWSQDGVVRAPANRVNAQLLTMLNGGLLVVWYTLTEPGHMDRSLMAALCVVVGVAGMAASYRLREHLLLWDQAGKGKKTGASPGYDFGRSVPRPRRVYLPRGLFGTALTSVIGAVLMLLFINNGLSKNGPDAVAIALGTLSGGTVLCVFWGWLNWNDTLREWRMLPLSRIQLGARIVGVTTLGCVLPWDIMLAAGGAVGIAQGTLSPGECIFCLGLSVLLQGISIAAAPFVLRRYEDPAGSSMPILITGAVAIALIVCIAPFSREIAHSFRSGSAACGGPLLVIGLVTFCAGMVVSAAHASHLLRHSDCYRKASE